MSFLLLSTGPFINYHENDQIGRIIHRLKEVYDTKKEFLYCIMNADYVKD